MIALSVEEAQLPPCALTGSALDERDRGFGALDHHVALAGSTIALRRESSRIR